MLRTPSLLAAAVVLVAVGPARPNDATHRSGRTRVYYIAADEVIWDYAPAGRNEVAGRPFAGIESMFTTRAATRIGSRYRKALYREYTDSTFTRL